MPKALSKQMCWIVIELRASLQCLIVIARAPFARRFLRYHLIEGSPRAFVRADYAQPLHVLKFSMTIFQFYRIYSTRYALDLFVSRLFSIL